MQTSATTTKSGKAVAQGPRSRWLLVGVGLGVGVLGLAAQILLRRSPAAAAAAAATAAANAAATAAAPSRINQLWTRLTARTYYKGGFQERMSLREASQILGTSISSPPSRIRDAHRRVILANHPDRGGSPYLAAKINAAKELMLQKCKK